MALQKGSDQITNLRDAEVFFSPVPRNYFRYPKNKGIYANYQSLTFADSNFCVGK